MTQPACSRGDNWDSRKITRVKSEEVEWPRAPTLLLNSCACRLSCFSHVRFFVTLWTVAHQAPLSMGFSRQEYSILEWVAMPFSRENLPDLGIEDASYISCNSRQVLYHQHHPGSPLNSCVVLERYLTSVGLYFC